MAEDEIQPLAPIHRIYAMSPVQEPTGRRPWRSWIAAVTRAQLRLGRSRLADRGAQSSSPQPKGTQEALRHAVEDETTGEGQVLDLEA